MNRRQTTVQASLEAQKKHKRDRNLKKEERCETTSNEPCCSELPDKCLNSPSKFPSTAFYETISTYTADCGLTSLGKGAMVVINVKRSGVPQIKGKLYNLILFLINFFLLETPSHYSRLFRFSIFRTARLTES
ncbi:hypothetical protein B9Z55_015711 [Caenorhabditis nigoni]|uniref:Uncharacterized protein n=1 Tax=Caenorhabditis nigoni TaxID=1611254 RepID=A0A2G5UBG0_9PELO|nr:hypothetical protein B9Z55_015711 [Caenorhabditis nigoni]